jgi:hypothetical protein
VQKSRANHYLDCEALAMAIGYSLNVQRIPDGVLREGTGDEPRLEDPRDTETENSEDRAVTPKSAATLAAAAVPDLRSRFAGLSSRLNR